MGKSISIKSDTGHLAIVPTAARLRRLKRTSPERALVDLIRVRSSSLASAFFRRNIRVHAEPFFLGFFIHFIID
jgi:hypothetical protein